MFTAIILMCASEITKSPETCQTLVKYEMFATEEQCMYDVVSVITSGVLEEQVKGMKPVDYYCVNWSALKA